MVTGWASRTDTIKNAARRATHAPRAEIGQACRGVRYARSPLRPESDFTSKFRLIWAVQSRQKKYPAWQFRKIMIFCRCPASSTRGAARSSRSVEVGCDGRAGLQRGHSRGRTTSARTVKSRGPDTPMPVSSLRRRQRRRVGDGDQKARRTGENAKQPLKPSRREGRIVRLDLWYLPPAFFEQAGHGPQSRSGLPCTLALERVTARAILGRESGCEDELPRRQTSWPSRAAMTQ